MSENPTSQPVHLNDLGQIALTVTDLPRAKDFYQNTLGLTLLYDAGKMAFFQIGTVRLMIGLPEPAEVDAPRGGTILYYRVTDLKATFEALKNAGVSFTHDPHVVAKMPNYELSMAFFKDPDENVIGLMNEVVIKTEKV